MTSHSLKYYLPSYTFLFKTLSSFLPVLLLNFWPLLSPPPAPSSCPPQQMLSSLQFRSVLGPLLLSRDFLPNSTYFISGTFTDPCPYTHLRKFTASQCSFPGLLCLLTYKTASKNNSTLKCDTIKSVGAQEALNVGHATISTIVACCFYSPLICMSF